MTDRETIPTYYILSILFSPCECVTECLDVIVTTFEEEEREREIEKKHPIYPRFIAIPPLPPHSIPTI